MGPWSRKHYFVLAAVILFVVAALAAHGTLRTDEAATFGYAGLAVFGAAFLPWRDSP